MALIVFLETDYSLFLNENEYPSTTSPGRVTHRDWVECLSGIWCQVPRREQLMVWLESGNPTGPISNAQEVRDMQETHGCMRPIVWLWGKVSRCRVDTKEVHHILLSIRCWIKVRATESLQCDRHWASHISYKVQQTSELDVIITFNPHRYPSKWVPLFYSFYLFLGRKAMPNLGNVLKSRDITLPTKVHIVKVMVFPVVMYGCESWTIKKAEHWRIDAVKLWC